MNPDPIKKRIQELCPDVMKKSFGYQIRILSNSGMGDELYKKFGTRLFWLGGENLKYYCYNGWIEFKMIDELERKNSVEHLGLPITLAVVLRAIGKVVQDKRHIVVNMIGGFAEYKSANGEMGLWMLAGGHMWNLEHDNYDQQSEDCKQFIGSLLNV